MTTGTGSTDSAEAAQTTVGQFLQNVSDKAQALANDVLEFVEFLRDRAYKEMREEHLPIRAYLLRQAVPLDTPLVLGGETHRFDAKVMHAAGEEILEVTQAIPKNAHQVRHGLAAGAMTARLRDLERKIVTSFPGPVIDAINKKVAHGYSEPRTLLVAVLGDHTFEDDAIILGWLPAIRQQTTRGNFSAIHLVDIARSKLFQIH